MFNGDPSSFYGRVQAWTDSLFVDHAVFRLVWSNKHTVIPKKVYRCNHPTPARLRQATRALGLRTLVNLRGHRPCGSDALSRQTAKHIGLTHVDMAFESRNAPHRERILRFAQLYKEMTFPMLMHCKSGADRAGLAAGLVILFEGGSAQQALQQLSWHYLHFNHSRTGILDAFFLHYQAEAEGRLPFLRWVETEYDEQRLKKDFTASTFSSFITDYLLKRE